MAEKAIYSTVGLIEDHGDDFASLAGEWNMLLDGLSGSHIFSTPLWGQIWWHHLGGGELHLLAVYREGHLIGISPLVRRGESVTLLGDKDVCDYLDIIASPGEEEGVLQATIDFTRQKGWRLDLYPLLASSPWVSLLISLAQQGRYHMHTESLDITYMLELPSSWEDYLNYLSSKQRHELRRKMRRLERAGKIGFSKGESADHDIEDFLRLFRGRPDKAAFLTSAREAFFREVVMEMGDREWLKLYFLEVEGKRVATTLCFDFKGVFSLYNSGFDPLYAGFSVGLIAKAWSIREAIEMGRKRFDFLRGAENYKAHLGGQPVEVYRSLIDSRVKEAQSSEAGK